MKNSIIKALIIKFSLGVFTLLFFTASVFAQNSIGYVDSDVILRQLPEYQQIQSELEGLQRMYLDTIQSKENELKNKAENFKNEYEAAQSRVETGGISEQEFNELNMRIGTLQQELQQLDQQLVEYKQEVQNILLQKQAELFMPVREKVTVAIENVAKDMKIQFVFDKADGGLIYGDRQFDITFRVLDKLK